MRNIASFSRSGAVLAAVAVLLLCAAIVLVGPQPPQRAEARPAATQVKIKNSWSGSVLRYTLYGKTPSGKVAWKRKCKSIQNAQYPSVNYAVRAKSVYLLDGARFYRLRLSDGKVLARAKSAAMFSYANLCVDSRGSFYTVRMEAGQPVYKLGKNGKRIWKAAFESPGGGAGIKIRGGRLVVSYEYSSYTYCRVCLNPKTGKVTAKELGKSLY